MNGAAPELTGLRAQVRELIAQWKADGRLTPRCDSWMRVPDLEFTAALAGCGLIGMTWPRAFGGGGRSNIARMVVTEELLRAGAPVAAHWIGDRQIGPAILRAGPSELAHEFLPRIARGEVTFCLGMSESEAGSDLAAVRTSAVPVAGGWRITGRKLWTTFGHKASHAYVLARTAPGEDRHEGLTEFIVDMAASGVAVRPIRDLSGQHHFNEVVFDGVLVPERWVIGEVGAGWKQVTEQLSFERGGMERVLSTYPLLAALASHAAGAASNAVTSAVTWAAVGELSARLIALREMAWSVAEELDAGRAPGWHAAVLKYLGTRFERDVAEVTRKITGVAPRPSGSDLPGLLGQALLAAPAFSIRGGTNEMLLTVISRGQPAKRSTAPENGHRALVKEMADQALRDPYPPSSANGAPDAFERLGELGWAGVGIAEERGGAGGSIADLAELAEATGRHAAALPFVEAAVARWVLSHGNPPAKIPGSFGVRDTIAFARHIEFHTGDGDGESVTFVAPDVGWLTGAHRIVLAGTDRHGRDLVAVLGLKDQVLDVETASNLAGEPRAVVGGRSVPIEALTPVAGAPPVSRIRHRAALLRAAASLGAIDAACALTAEHVSNRTQFGRRLVSFQAVSHSLARMRAAAALARVAVAAAVAAAGTEIAAVRLAAARVVVDQSGDQVARLAHQLHGAMGMTSEYGLHLFTTRLWSWRDELGSTGQWAADLGELVTREGEKSLWDAVTTRSWT
ncbi:MAG: acyl-CoA dehydrogenase family protein [Micromonosporaceae bacterium]